MILFNISIFCLIFLRNSCPIDFVTNVMAFMSVTYTVYLVANVGYKSTITDSIMCYVILLRWCNNQESNYNLSTYQFYQLSFDKNIIVARAETREY